MNDAYKVRQVDLKTLDERAWQQYLQLLQTLREERDPLRPVPSVAELKRSVHKLPTFTTRTTWLVTDQQRGELAGRGELWAYNEQMASNRHIGEVNVDVLPAYRREGIGLRLLKTIAAYAESCGHTQLISATSSRVPAGELFAKQLGAKVGTTVYDNQLDLSELNVEKMRRWRAHGDSQQAFELLFVDGRYPDSLIESFVELKKVMNSQPRDDLDIEDMEYTAEDLRQLEKVQLHSGRTRWTYAARHRTDGRLAGYSEMSFRPSVPLLAFQGDTGVVPEFRGRRIGRWLKATMALRVIAEKPDVRFIRSSNATTNQAMLKINSEMGFKPYSENKIWQIATAEALRYLSTAVSG